MNIYVAGGLELIDVARKLITFLAAVPGITITYDWTQHGSVQGLGPGRYREVATREAQGVLDADLVIAIPGGKGTHVEMGIAIGRGIPIMLLDPNSLLWKTDLTRDCVFHFHPLVSRIEVDALQDFQGFLDLLTALVTVPVRADFKG